MALQLRDIRPLRQRPDTDGPDFIYRDEQLAAAIIQGNQVVETLGSSATILSTAAPTRQGPDTDKQQYFQRSVSLESPSRSDAIIQ